MSLQVGQWAISWIWGSAQCPTLRTTHTVILTLLDIPVLWTGRWHTVEQRYSSTHASRSFTPETRAKRTHCIRSGVGPGRFGDEISCTDGDRTTIRNTPSPYPRHQTTPWFDTVQVKRVLLQMKSQPVTVLIELSTQYKSVNSEGQSSVMSKGTQWLPPCRNIGKHCQAF